MFCILGTSHSERHWLSGRRYYDIQKIAMDCASGFINGTLLIIFVTWSEITMIYKFCFIVLRLSCL